MEFQAVPDYRELEALPREFSFQPCTTENPQVLSREQIRQFNEQGFLSGIEVFCEEEIGRHREWFDTLLQRVLAEGKDAYSISTAHLKYGYVYDLLVHPRIVAVVRDLLGPNVIGWGSHYFCKLPGDDKQVAWHQDATYWPLTPTRTVTVWLAIDDSDLENGCVQFVAGSHRFGRIPFRPTSPEERNVLNQLVEGAERLGPIVPSILKAGQISVHSDLLVHGSQPNRSPRRRCGLTLRYCPPEVRAFMNWHLKGVVVCGRDPYGHWANPQRPAE